MGNRSAPRTDGALEGNAQGINLSGFVSLDGSSNVIGFLPTASPPNLAGPGNNLPYTRMRGFQAALGPAGAIITQPHTTTGTYIFTFDEPWSYALEAWVQQIDPGAVQSLNPFLDVNCTGATGSTVLGYMPGQNQSLPAQTVRIRFRTNVAGGALTDPAANTGFWFGMKVFRGAPQ